MSAPTLFEPERPAATSAAGPRPYVIELPDRLSLLNSNQRMNKHERAALTRSIRAAASAAVEECPSLLDVRDAVRPNPVFPRAHILGVLHPHSTGRRDPANWYPSFKAAIDGLVDAGLFADDDHTRVLGPDMRLGARRGRDQIVLVVRALAPGEDPLGYRGVGR
ncbi:hypothetical protein ACFWFU_07080 [Streptomyces sp. NPDC060235]|uniref:hypothetical protein n=1 Tax=Streptomyces sp. NPDC060235 TaxID=3347080 RepID=UPI003657D586